MRSAFIYITTFITVADANCSSQSKNRFLLFAQMMRVAFKMFLSKKLPLFGEKKVIAFAHHTILINSDVLLHYL